jgi:hypothetical protein
MTTRKKTTTGKTKIKKLELKRETIKDLDVKGSGKRIKGGGVLNCAISRKPSCQYQF